ncbi:MAG: type II toxin-antitoxin system RelB/DinJ family antitoxin [Candidatus Methanomethylophilaceae archaeon]|nr:type II toxin-antitoxin system RelB/DinJ family antitoxin [Candidatus Methanomethylophilaceae archaeon]
MTTSAFTVRMDEELKARFEEMCNSFGINMTAAINLFATAVVNEGRIPFEIRTPRITREDAISNFERLRVESARSNPKGMSLEEINSEIDATRPNDDH